MTGYDYQQQQDGGKGGYDDQGGKGDAQQDQGGYDKGQ